jgi:anti-anti-sigma factor
MSVSTQVSDDKGTVTIKVNGRFDFNVVQDFRNAYRAADAPSASYVIDLGETDYMDSSALGMLLHLWKFAGSGDSRIRIVNCRPGVRKIFEITHFDKKFVIE